jgi:hypothetical protein
MEYKTYNKETIIPATAKLMGFINFSFCEYGMKLAMQRELADLKGAVDPAEFTGIEFTLLGGLSDPAIKLMMEDVKAIDDTIRVLLMINSMDELEVMTDVEGSDLANEIHQSFTCDPLPADDYRAIVNDITYLYQTTTYSIYLMALLFTSGGLDLAYHRDGDYHDYWYLDQNMELLDRDDKNVSLLYDLIISRQRQQMRMLDIFLTND